MVKGHITVMVTLCAQLVVCSSYLTSLIGTFSLFIYKFVVECNVVEKYFFHRPYAGWLSEMDKQGLHFRS